MKELKNLEQGEIQELIKRPKNRSLIAHAVDYQCKIDMFVQSICSEYDFNKAHNEFLHKIEQMYSKANKEQYNRFEMFFKQCLPLPTSEVVNESIKQLHRVVTADGGRIHFSFDNADKTIRFNSERKDDDVIREDLFKSTINNITSITTIDINEDKSFYKFVPATHIIDFGYYVDNNGDVTINYLIYRSNTNEVVCIDGYKYITLSIDDFDNIEEVLQLSEHGIGYAPLCLTYENPSKKNPLINFFPVSEQLGGLWLLLKAIIEHEALKEYARRPIISKYEEKGDYENFASNDDLNTDNVSNFEDNSTSLVAPGSVIETAPPIDRDSPDLTNSFQWISAPVESLEYNDKDIEDMKNRIYQSIVGNGAMGTYKNESARNETEVMASFEGLKSTLDLFKKPMEKTHKFIVTTCAVLDEGELPIEGMVNYGNEYYLKPVSLLEDEFKKAKNSGASESTLLSIRQKIIHTQYIDDPLTKERELLLLELEPFPVHSVSNVSSLLSQNIVSERSLQIKAYFNNFVQKIENRFGNINTFVNSQITETKGKTEVIDEIIKDYFYVWLDEINEEKKDEQNNLEQDEINTRQQI